MKIAIPTQDGALCQHFGRCPFFSIFEVADNHVQDKQVLQAPEHAHGSHPNFLKSVGCDVVVCGGIGDHAIGMLKEMGVAVHAGAPSLPVDEVVALFLAGSLEFGDGRCQHDGCGGHHHHDNPLGGLRLDNQALA